MMKIQMKCVRKTGGKTDSCRLSGLLEPGAELGRKRVPVAIAPSTLLRRLA